MNDIGENGAGKSTLMKIPRRALLAPQQSPSQSLVFTMPLQASYRKFTKDVFGNAERMTMLQFTV